jgi:hypothetical protein
MNFTDAISDLVRNAVWAPEDEAEECGYQPSDYEEFLHRDLIFAMRLVQDDVEMDGGLQREIISQFVSRCLIPEDGLFPSAFPGSAGLLRGLDDTQRPMAEALLTSALLNNDEDSNVRYSAASALGQLGQPSESVLNALTSALLNNDETLFVRSSALQSLGAVVSR